MIPGDHRQWKSWDPAGLRFSARETDRLSKWSPVIIQRHWSRDPAGIFGFLLICASLGALGALLVIR